MPVTCLRFSDWPIPIHNWVLLYIFHLALSGPFSDVLYFEECQTKNISPCFFPNFVPPKKLQSLVIISRYLGFYKIRSGIYQNQAKML